MSQRIIVALTGATGQIFGVQALKILKETDVDSHLILSEASKINLSNELGILPKDVSALADESYSLNNIGAPLASGSFQTQGMLVAPCSMKTLSNITMGHAANLITRAADVTLKEKRPLLLMPREKPLNRIHLENMLRSHDAGAIIYPPLLSFYQFNDMEQIKPMVNRSVARALDLLGVPAQFDEWEGIGKNQ